ncbi:hypothetical protein [Phenylobacterium sp.]|uniref:hypothetical protein n=1 Tax=Phenylobacterium sp. TaxID=1871053 RepID=UPI002DE2B8CD|nr:hypothetical protein [Phenylobacterium sp.]
MRSREGICLILSSATLALLLAACGGDLATRLCRADRFFCADEAQWPEEARHLSPIALYVLDEKYSRIVRESDGSFVLDRELASRGQAAVDAILVRTESEREVDTYLLVDVLDQVRWASKVDICQSSVRERAHTVLGRSALQDLYGLAPDERIKLFDALCSLQK